MRRRWGSAFSMVASLWLTGGPAYAFDVPAFLQRAAQSPGITAAEREIDVRAAEAALAAHLAPWNVDVKQEGIGPTDPGNQVSYLTLGLPFDPYGKAAAQAAALRLRVDAQRAQVRHLRLERQLAALDTAWAYLAAQAQIKAIDEGLARLDRWQKRLSLRVSAGKLPAMALDRFAVSRGELTTLRAATEGKQALAAADLAARGLQPLVTAPWPDPAKLPTAPADYRSPGVEALAIEERAIEAQQQALTYSAWPSPSLNVELERYNSFSAGQHALGVALGLELPNWGRLADERLKWQAQGAQTTAQRQEAVRLYDAQLARWGAQQKAASAERQQLRQVLLPGIDHQSGRLLLLVELGRADVFSFLDLERRRLDASLRDIDLLATELQGGYAQWLLAGGS